MYSHALSRSFTNTLLCVDMGGIIEALFAIDFRVSHAYV
eukprot:COSAG05_NODE_525_length_8961_cov_212.374591_6_plen_39_part_00